MSAGLGADWAIRRSWTKVYPCCGVLHTAVHALEALRETIQPEQVRQIRIGTSRRGVEQHSDTAPSDPMQAQYSMHFCAALALTGNPRDAQAFAAGNLRDDAVLAMIPRISLHVDPEIHAVYPDKFAARVDVELDSGAHHLMTVWDAHGMPAEPCGEAEISLKFENLCTPVIGAAATRDLQAAITGLATGQAGLDDVSRALRGGFA